MDHTADGHEPVVREEEAIQHPLGIYFKIWILLFVLSAMSYAVDYYQVQGYMRWFLILFFMVLKDHRGVYAHGVGAIGNGLLHTGAASVTADSGGHWLARGRLDILSARCVLPEGIGNRGTGVSASLKQSA